jgi:hypothetical protein
VCGVVGTAEQTDQPERAQPACSILLGAVARARLSWVFGPFAVIGASQRANAARRQGQLTQKDATNSVPLLPYIHMAGSIRLAYYLLIGFAPRSEVVGYLAAALYILTFPYFLPSIVASVIASRGLGGPGGTPGWWCLAVDATEFAECLLLYIIVGRRHGPKWAAWVLAIGIILANVVSLFLIALSALGGGGYVDATRGRTMGCSGARAAELFGTITAVARAPLQPIVRRLTG